MAWASLKRLVLAGAVVPMAFGQVPGPPCGQASSSSTPGYATTIIAGGGPASGAPATSIALSSVYGMAVDTLGNLYVASSEQNRVYKVLPNGRVFPVAGDGTCGYSGDGGSATGAQLNRPHSVAIDSAGSLYIGDGENLRIRKVSGGVITTVAGNGGCCYSGDGGPATNATIGNAIALAVDGLGNIFLFDNNGRIRKVAGGVISTVAGNGTFGYSGDGGLATNAQIGQVNGPFAACRYVGQFGKLRPIVNRPNAAFAARRPARRPVSAARRGRGPRRAPVRRG